jgi:uncharacterized membrane protein YozB (DUF420 family)
LQSFQQKIVLGVAIGLAMPALGVVLMLVLRPELQSIQQFEAEIVKQVNVQLITLGMIINAGLFFLFMRFNQEAISRGILLASLALLIGIFVYRFF